MEAPSSWGIDADTRIIITCLDDAAKIVDEDGEEAHKTFSLPCASATVKCEYCPATLEIGVHSRAGLLMDISSAGGDLRDKIYQGVRWSGATLLIGVLLLIVAAGFVGFAGVWLLDDIGFANTPNFLPDLGDASIFIGLIGFVFGIGGLVTIITSLAARFVLSGGELREDRLYLVGEDFYPDIAHDHRSRQVALGLTINIIRTLNPRGHGVSLGDVVGFAFSTQGVRLSNDVLYDDQNIPSDVIDCIDAKPVYSRSANSAAERVRDAG